MNEKQLEEVLTRELSKIWEYCQTDSNREWTIAVKRILVKINDEFIKKKIATSSIENVASGEWLIDFLIYDENKQGFLNSIVLAAEIEWRNFTDYFPQLKYDFEKLLVLKSKIKLFIFESENSEEISFFLNSFQEIFSNFNNQDFYLHKEIFYLIIWNRSSQKFEILNLNKL